MGETTGIAWCDHTFNPWIGCTKVSAACDHCYAQTLAERYGWATWGVGEPRYRTKESNWQRPLSWNRAAAKAGVRRRVFCASLADIFDAEVHDQWRLDLFALIDKTRNLDWLLLTKRPQVAKKFYERFYWPTNIWLGTTVEDQKMADLRIPILLSIPAKVHFLSCEPLLEVVTLRTEWLANLDWIIVGGESGPHWRPTPVGAFERLRDQSRLAGIFFFAKQVGGHPDKRAMLDDFPADLRIRDFPRSPACAKWEKEEEC